MGEPIDMSAFEREMLSDSTASFYREWQSVLSTVKLMRQDLLGIGYSEQEADQFVIETLQVWLRLFKRAAGCG